jgi:hypothetical protein
VTPPKSKDPGAVRSRTIARVLGITGADAADMSLNGRLKTVARLREAKRVEIARGRAQSWLYDVNRHLNLAVLLEREEAALMADLVQAASNYNQVAV